MERAAMRYGGQRIATETANLVERAIYEALPGMTDPAPLATSSRT
jgi:hypothetical protein